MLGYFQTHQALLGSEAATSGHEVEDQDYHRDDQQNVNQAAGNMKAETQ
jgi:hypothetical protein